MSKEPTISTSEFTDLCAGRPVMVQHAINGWLNQPDKQRVLEKSIGDGGTDVTLPRDEVKQIFELGILAIDPEKIKINPYKRQFERLKEKHGLSDEDLGIKSSA